MESIVLDIEAIQSEAPAKEPKSYPTVGFESLRYIDPDQVADAIQQAFDGGYCRAMWLVDQKLQPIADRVSMLEAELEEMNKFLSGEPDNGH